MSQGERQERLVSTRGRNSRGANTSTPLGERQRQAFSCTRNNPTTDTHREPYCGLSV